MNISEIIKYPLLSEKTYEQMSNNIYTFVVDKKASKIEIKKAVEFIFDVKVDRVNIINVDKKRKRVGRYEGFKKAYKKAIVSLKEGSISIFPDEGIAADEGLKELNESKKAIELKPKEEKTSTKKPTPKAKTSSTKKVKPKEEKTIKQKPKKEENK